MADVGQNLTISLHSTADLSSKQYHAVIYSGEYGIAAVSDANGAGAAKIPVGILQNDPASDGEAAEVCIMGRCRARVGGSVSAGNVLGMNDTGELIAAPYEAAIGTADLHCFAIALEDGADNEIIDVIVFAPGVPGSTE